MQQKGYGKVFGVVQPPREREKKKDEDTIFVSGTTQTQFTKLLEEKYRRK